MIQFLKDIWQVLKGTPAIAEPIELSPCAAYQRHLYLGGEFCKRGCGTRNKDFKAVVDAVPTEGA